MIISNEYRTCSLSTPAVAREVNAARGHDLDPLDLLILLEDRAAAAWQLDGVAEPQQRFMARYVRSAIDNL